MRGGRWEWTDMRDKRGGTDGLEAGIEFDDELLVDGGFHLVADRQADHVGFERLGIEGQPPGDVAKAVLVQPSRGDLARRRGGLDLDLVARFHVVTGNVDLP